MNANPRASTPDLASTATSDRLVLAPFAFDAVAAIEASARAADLMPTAEAAFSRVGADIFVCVELRVTPNGPDVRAGFGRTTPDWKERYCETGHLADDPLIRHALGSAEAACWSDLERNEPPSDGAERRALEQARRIGIQEALIAPQHRPGGGVGAVLVMSQSPGAVSIVRRQALIMLSGALYRAARRLGLGGAGGGDVDPGLTRREAEALYWAAGGAKDKEIAAAMALSPATVTGYVHVAQRKLGVRGRILAARRAAELNLLPAFVRSAAPRA